MTNYKSCPQCSSLAVFNSHFGAYFCNSDVCHWFDNSYNIERINNHTKLNNSELFNKNTKNCKNTDK